MKGNVIDHCDFTSQIAGVMESDDFKETVHNRVEQIVSERMTGKIKSKPHNLPGVELTAQHLADKVIESGVRRILRDLDIEYASFVDHACSLHISSC
jgi:hypothetical protein